LEFLEMLGRVADYAQQKDLQTSLDYEDYLGMVID
jgi:hypothetical protein